MCYIGSAVTGWDCEEYRCEPTSSPSALHTINVSASSILNDVKNNLGGDNNLAVVLGIFRPQVRCAGSLHGRSSCGHVLADMPASTALEVFGPPDAPHVKEKLPQEVVSGELPISAAILYFLFSRES